ncbi:MAG: hypothetical protein VX454_00170 [Pseudomonadota bacterium]|jgi:hypothetical protein|nr:hypothetical protein [Pseudomonadota bacterium]
MTNPTTTQSAEHPWKWKKILFATTLGATGGFLGAMAFMKLGMTGNLGELGPSQEIAALVGLVYALTGVAIGIGLVLPRAGATYLNVEDAGELTEQRPMLACSALAMLALGIALIVAALAQPVGIIPPGVVVPVFAIAGVLATVLGVLSRHRQDELMRAMGRESAGLAFYLLALVGGIWALSGHLGYSAPPAPLDWLTLIWSLLLIAAFIVVGRHGMMKMR